MRLIRSIQGLLIGALVLVAPVAFAQDAATSSGDAPEIIFVLHGLNPYTSIIKAAAEDAAKDLGVTVEVLDTGGFVAENNIALLEGAIEQDPDGIVVVPYPVRGDEWADPIQAAADAGIPLVQTFLSVEAAAPLRIGPDQATTGRLLAEELRRELEAMAQTDGLIVAGVCNTEDATLQDRYESFREALAGTDFDVSTAYNVGVAPEVNAENWAQVLEDNTGLVAAVGFCSMDVGSLAEIKRETGGEWLIGGYELDAPTREAIADGTATLTISEQPYLQGYLPVLALAQHLQDGEPLPEGWIETPSEVVTAEHIAEINEREASDDSRADHYEEYVAEHFADLQAIAVS